MSTVQPNSLFRKYQHRLAKVIITIKVAQFLQMTLYINTTHT